MLKYFEVRSADLLSIFRYFRYILADNRRDSFDVAFLLKFGKRF